MNIVKPAPIDALRANEVAQVATSWHKLAQVGPNGSLKKTDIVTYWPVGQVKTNRPTDQPTNIVTSCHKLPQVANSVDTVDIVDTFDTDDLLMMS